MLYRRIPPFLLSLILIPRCWATDAIEGSWVGESGPADNRATLGLEVTRAADGTLSARLSLDLLGIYGMELGAVQRASSNAYNMPAAEMSLTLGEGELRAAGLLHDSTATVTMKRVARLPTAPPRPSFPAGPAPRWQTRLGGSIFAPVAVLDGVAYVGNADGVLSAVRISDGTRQWSFAAGRPIFGEALATDDAVYFVCDNGFLFRLDRMSGKELWRYDLGDGRVPRVLPNPFIYDYDYRAPRPALADGVLFVGSGDGSLHAVRASSGERIWRVETNGKIRNAVAIAGSNAIAVTQSGLVQSIELGSGRTNWQFDAKAAVTAPAIIDGRVIVGSRDSMLYALDPADGHPVWTQYWWGSWVESSAAERDGLAYIGAGDLDRVSCIEPSSGRNQWRSEVGGWVLQRPLVTDKIVYVGVSGARRAAKHWPPQASALVALDRLTGRVIWQWSMPELPGTFLHGFIAAPVIAGRTVLIGGVDGTLYAFPDS